MRSVSTCWLLLARCVGSDLDASALGQTCVRVRFAVLAAHWLHDFRARTCFGRGGLGRGGCVVAMVDVGLRVGGW